MDKTARIRELNDRLKRTFEGGRVVMTQGVAALPDELKAAALEQMRTFNAFTEENDPHGEHDFGNFSVGTQRFYFKLDLYEEPDVKDANGRPAVTRVLTIMLADEY